MRLCVCASVRLCAYVSVRLCVCTFVRVCGAIDVGWNLMLLEHYAGAAVSPRSLAPGSPQISRHAHPVQGHNPLLVLVPSNIGPTDPSIPTSVNSTKIRSVGKRFGSN